MKLQSRSLAALLLAFCLGLGAFAAQAAVVTTDFTVTLDSGALAGNSYSGWFSYDEADAIGDGSVPLNGFGFDFAGISYGLTDAAIPPLFWTELFSGLDYIASDFSIGFVSGIADVVEGYFAYELPGATVGYGDIAYEPAAAVPLPATALLVLAGLLPLGLRRR